MSDTMPLNLIKSLDFPLKFTEKGTTSSGQFSKKTSYTMFKQDRNKSRLKLPIETCKMSFSQSESSFTQKLTSSIKFTKTLGKIIRRKFYLQFVMKSSGQLSLSSQLHNFSLKETKFHKELKLYSQKGPLTSTSSLIT